MYPTIQNKQKLLVVKYVIKSPQVNDIVVCKHPVTEVLLIKRIKKHNKNLYWVEGDNKEESTDSRDFGWIEKKYILGHVVQFR